MGQAYALGPVVKVNSASVTKIATSTFATDANLRLNNSSFPGVNFDFSPFSSGSYVTNLTISNVEKYINSTLVGVTIPAASTWTIEFYEKYQDGLSGVSEQNLSNMSFVLTGTYIPAVTDSFYVAGPVNSIDGRNDPSNVRVNLGLAASTYALESSVLVNSAALTKFVSGTFGREAALRLRNSAHPYSFADFSPATVEGYSGTHAVPAGPRPLVGPLVGSTIPAGSTWTAEFFETYDDSLNAPEQSISDLSFGVGAGQAYVPAAQPSNVMDLGNLNGNSGTITRPSGPIAPGQVRWYKFRVPEVNGENGIYFDINTEITNQTGGVTDTEIALYTADGRLIEQDDEDGYFAMSALSFGDFVNPRPAPGNLSLPFDGRDGEGLAAGTYFLATGAFNSYFYPGFVVTNNSITAYPEGFNLVINTNVPNDQNVMAGVLILENIPSFGEEVQFYLRNPAGVETLLENVQTNSDGTFRIVTSQTGLYKLVARKDGFLASASAQFSLGGSGYPAYSFVLKNGDIDRDHEVGPSDFEFVVNLFGLSSLDAGFVPAADLDRDGEIGPGDFEIIVTNFGLSDE